MILQKCHKKKKEGEGGAGWGGGGGDFEKIFFSKVSFYLFLLPPRKILSLFQSIPA